MTNIININNSPWVALSAEYPYDTNISLSPTIVEREDGYRFFKHPIFTNSKDVKLAKDSLFILSSAISLADYISNIKYIDAKDLVIYTSFQAENSKYITNNNNTLYITSSSSGDTELFRLLKQQNGNFKIYYNDLVFTVDREAPYNVTLEDELSEDAYKTQEFTLYYNQENQKLIKMMKEKELTDRKYQLSLL